MGGALWIATQSFHASTAASSTGTSSTSGFGTPTTSTTTPQTSAAKPTTGAMIVPGSSADPIVGNNLMLGTDQNSKLGTYLLGYTGMTLYTYAKDNVGTSTCYGDCAQTWSPYIVSPSDRGTFEYGVNPLDVGTITRADGSLQLTYNDHPLYFYSGDTTGSDYNGQGVHGVWYVVAP